MATDLTVTESPIPGLFVVKLPIHGDDRGWFKENYQKEKMEALDLPEFTIVQNNISFNQEKGVTRGMHAEPWNKFVAVANGKIFSAWVDLRPGETYGTQFSIEMDESVAVFVPKGVANGFQTLTENTTYAYLVDDHWSPEAKYTLFNAFDPEVAIEWPISQEDAIVSDKDVSHPPLSEIKSTAE